MIKVIVAGGRYFDDYELVENTLLHFISEKGIEDPYGIIIVSGGSRGADALGELFAEECGVAVELHKADWGNVNAPNALVRRNANGHYNARAGFDRNVAMAHSAEHLVAFWDGKSKGTKHMIDTAHTLGLDVTVVYY